MTRFFAFLLDHMLADVGRFHVAARPPAHVSLAPVWAAPMVRGPVAPVLPRAS